MKQEPVLSSKNDATKDDISQNLTVKSLCGRSHHILCFCSAMIWHLICLVVIVLCFQTPMQTIPFHSEVEVSFEENIQTVPAEITPLSEPAESFDKDLSLETPALSEALPETDHFSEIPIAKPIQKQITPIRKRKGDMTPEQTKSIDNSTHQRLNLTQNSDQSHQKNVQSISTAKVSSPSILSSAQRCSAPIGNYPMAARRRHEQGKAIIRFQLLPDGQITQVAVDETSGFSDLDQAAIQAVQHMKCQAVTNQPILKTMTSVHFRLH